MELIPGDPFDQSEQEDKSRPKKRKSLLDNIREIKKIYDNIQKITKYTRVVVSAFNPAIWIPIGIFALVFFIIILNNDSTSALNGGGGGGGSDDSSSAPGGPVVPAIPGFNIDIDGPQEAENGIDLEYTVTITHDPAVAPPLASIEVYDSLPAGASLVSTTGVLKPGSSSPNIWPLSETPNQGAFQIIIRPNQTDTFFNYSVSARQIAGSGGTGGGVPPTADNCNGKYEFTHWTSKNPLNANYGDPLCDFTKDDLYTLIQQTDPANADFWYTCARMESTYVPNAYAGPETGTPDQGGAWGLYQMGRGLNGPTDHGDVEWKQQLQNAVAHSKKTNSFKDYWQCARDLNYDGIR